MLAVRVVEGGVTRFAMARRVFGKDLYRCACYLVDGLLVDSGIAHLRNAFADLLSAHRVRAIVNTHAHEDHIGANAILQRTRGVPVFAHEMALPIIADPRKLRLLPYQRLFFGLPSPSEGQPLRDALHTERHTFEIIHAPGHSPDHVVLYERSEGWIFSGDAFIGGQDRVAREGCDLPEAIRTLKELSSLPADVMFTGMGHVVRGPARHIARKLSYYEEVADRIGTLGREGMDAAGIARRLFPGDTTVRIVTSGDFSAVRLVRSFLPPP